ncbi:hypothetical protein ACPPVT_16815 [Angustibacter sp. McL0619]|uniref:hypothetical protein n=1 Tax=Angustibacter sp. McL0619 TaxID=3415676 RepID=UPI003CF87B2B
MSGRLADGGAILAHGVGSRQDLPLPFALAVTAAAVALVVSFVLLAVLWREPRLDGAHAGRPLPRWAAALLDSRATRTVLAAVGAVFTVYVLVPLLLGKDDADNPVPFVVFVLLWVGLVPLSVLFGPVWRRLNPLRHLHSGVMRLARLDPRQGALALPRWLGYWPAALGLLGFTWLELVAPNNSTLPVMRLAITAYATLQLLAGFLFGSHWFDRGDPLEVWSGLFGRLSVFGRRADGVLVLRSPLAGLDALQPAAGLVATVAVMLGTTAYDGASNAPRWFTFVQTSPMPQVLTKTLGLLAVVGLVAALFSAATALAGWVGGVSPRAMPRQFAHSLVPVALGYVIAHYWSLLVLEGQNAFILLSDPLGTGQDWLGLSHRAPDTTLLTPHLVADVQVSAIILGHVVGVVLAHDRAVRLFPRRHALVGQLPLLALMVTYTCGGLFLLFAA